MVEIKAPCQARPPEIVVRGKWRDQHVVERQPDRADFRVAGCKRIEDATGPFHVSEAISVKVGQPARVKKAETAKGGGQDDKPGRKDFAARESRRLIDMRSPRRVSSQTIEVGEILEFVETVLDLGVRQAE